MANEKRLIDANEICYQEVYVPTTNGAKKVWAVTETDIDEMPDVDAVELPPIKIGDMAHFIIGGNVYKAKVHFIRWEQHEQYGIHSELSASVTPNYSVGASFDDFGRTVFLTEEEAKAALAKMDGDGNG